MGDHFIPNDVTSNESDEDSDPVADGLPTLTADAMTPSQLSDRLEELVHELHRYLSPDQEQAILVAASRVRRSQGLRDALVDRIGQTLQLEDQLRGREETCPQHHKRPDEIRRPGSPTSGG